jgi:hypothetical protein
VSGGHSDGGCRSSYDRGSARPHPPDCLGTAPRRSRPSAG